MIPNVSREQKTEREKKEVAGQKKSTKYETKTDEKKGKRNINGCTEACIGNNSIPNVHSPITSMKEHTHIFIQLVVKSFIWFFVIFGYSTLISVSFIRIFFWCCSLALVCMCVCAPSCETIAKTKRVRSF